MSYVVIARWKAAPGNETDVESAIRRLSTPSLAEPGCLRYRAHRVTSDAGAFLIYEEYVDERAYQAHTESEHFARYALGEGIPLLDSRDREFCSPLEE
jgi:quinol monooxygenase YgiN